MFGDLDTRFMTFEEVNNKVSPDAMIYTSPAVVLCARSRQKIRINFRVVQVPASNEKTNYCSQIKAHSLGDYVRPRLYRAKKLNSEYLPARYTPLDVFSSAFTSILD